MEQLLEKIMSVQSRSDSVNTSLFDKREHIEKLHRTCNLLRKVQVPPVGLFSNCLVQQKVLHPFRKQEEDFITALQKKEVDFVLMQIFLFASTLLWFG
nr:histone deacetylase 2 isoform X4 [Arachis hypogaea]